MSGGSAQAGEVFDHWTVPAVTAGAETPAESGPPAGPNVFGTVALPVHARQTGTRWTKLMGASLNQPVLVRLAAQARGQSREQQAAYVQSAVSRALRPRTDSRDCSDDGYWAPGGETLARGLGDCFDVAIAKMEALRSLGFADRDLYLTTGYFHARGTAALLVRIGDGFVLLPDGRAPVIAANGGGEFNPYITYGYGMSWVHGRTAKRGSPAATEAASTGRLVALAR